MRLVVFSDVHVHPWSAFSRLDETGVNTRLRDTLSVLSIVKKTAAEEYADAVIFCGDLFHTTKIDADTLALTGRELEAFGSLGIPILAIEGNHDQASRVRELTSVSALRVPKNWKWLRAESVTVKGHVIWGAPFGHLEPPDVEADIAILHRGVKGAQISDYFQSAFENDLDPSEALKYAQKLVISGHYHKPQFIDDWDVPILVPGAPMQHTWGDQGQERGIWVVDIHQDDSKFSHGIDAKFVPLSFPRFVRVTTSKDLEGLGEDFVSIECEDPKLAGELISDEFRSKARGISVEAHRPEVLRTGSDRIQVGADLEKAVRDYVGRFAKERREERLRLGLEILKGVRT